MSMNSLLADALARLRNAKSAKHLSVEIPYSGFVKSVFEVLQREGYVGAIEEEELRPGVKVMCVALRYFQGESVISTIKMVSKPGCRRYFKLKDLPSVNGGLGVSVLSTPRGVLSDSEARRLRVGGELICNVF